MSRLIEFSDDELKALQMLMNKFGFNVPQVSVTKPKKISKSDAIRQSMMEARAKKELRKRNN